MGLDGGTVISRTDVLRGASWRLASSDPSHRCICFRDAVDGSLNNSESTRGGQLSSEFVARRETVDAQDLAQAQWTSCSLTGEALREPIVMCELGKFYNKEAVIQYILGSRDFFVTEEAKYLHENRQQFDDDFCHLTRLKDVFSVKISFEEKVATSSRTPTCPIASVNPLNGQQFVALRPCGHVLSQKAVDQILGPKVESMAAAAEACPLCSQQFNPSHDVVLVHPRGEELSKIRTRILEELSRRSKRKRTKTSLGGESRDVPIAKASKTNVKDLSRG